jgi:hypothetical protein
MSWISSLLWAAAFLACGPAWSRQLNLYRLPLPPCCKVKFTFNLASWWVAAGILPLIRFHGIFRLRSLSESYASIQPWERLSEKLLSLARNAEFDPPLF